VQSSHDKHPRRPPRLGFIFTDAPLYFLTFNTFNRIRVLACQDIHESFRSFCLRAINKNVAVGRYVLMPDHAHLFVMIPPTGITLADWVKALRTVIGKRLLVTGVDKPHWQEGFFDHVLRSAESYGQKWEYLRMNPVRAGLCNSADEWPYQGEIMLLPFD
jgi:REP element-mobilizing transposase RayT